MMPDIPYSSASRGKWTHALRRSYRARQAISRHWRTWGCVIACQEARGHKTSDAPSTYQPLFDHLAAATGDAVTLTYREVAALIGGPLPETAILHTGWWRGKHYDHVQAWQPLGWRADASAANLRVVFTRDAEDGSPRPDLHTGGAGH